MLFNVKHKEGLAKGFMYLTQTLKSIMDVVQWPLFYNNGKGPLTQSKPNTKHSTVGEMEIITKTDSFCQWFLDDFMQQEKGPDSFKELTMKSNKQMDLYTRILLMEK